MTLGSVDLLIVAVVIQEPLLMTPDIDLYNGQDPHEVFLYTNATARVLLQIPHATMMYFDPYLFDLRPQVSFVQLLQLHLMHAVYQVHPGLMGCLRQLIRFKRNYGEIHPLLHLILDLDGVDSFIEEFGEWVTLAQSVQVALHEKLLIYLQRVECRCNRPYQYFPFSRAEATFDQPKLVVMNPQIAFGQPTIVASGVQTCILFERFVAGDSIEDLMWDYDCDRLLVEEAIRFEARLEGFHLKDRGLC